jgi:hypothetical protein
VSHLGDVCHEHIKEEGLALRHAVQQGWDAGKIGIGKSGGVEQGRQERLSPLDPGGRNPSGADRGGRPLPGPMLWPRPDFHTPHPGTGDRQRSGSTPLGVGVVSVGSHDLETCSDDDYFFVMTLGFCRWILDITQQHDPHFVNLRAAFCYQVFPNASRPDMLSVAIRFTPVLVAATDPLGLAVADTNPVDECDAAVQFATKVKTTVNIDQKLTDDPALREILVDEGAHLLEEAGYDRVEYREWVAAYPS